jgi:hypothetical protein
MLVFEFSGDKFEWMKDQYSKPAGSDESAISLPRHPSAPDLHHTYPAVHISGFKEITMVSK